jgi:hypothetical protein
MYKFRVWCLDIIAQEQIIEANDMDEALDTYCKEAGYIDHADMCQELELEESIINIEWLKPEE